MKKHGNDAAIQELTSKGYSKAKSAQALRDAGNNSAVALRLLEQQSQRDAARGQPIRKSAPAAGQTTSELGNGGSPFPSSAASIPSLQRTPQSRAPQTEAQRMLQRQRARRHPCVVQYGSCQYGDYCLLKDFPGDVCVQHAQGSCIYGPACRHRHVVDGVDVRDVVRAAYVPFDPSAEEETKEELLMRPDGTVYTVQDSSAGAKVRVATLVSTDDGDAAPSHRDASGLVGSRHADPDGLDGEAVPPAMAHPTPFLDLARTGPPASPHARNIGVYVKAPASAATSAVGGTGGRAVGKHPCVAQYGSCKYGTACVHADRDADVCVHYLSDRCRFSAAECRYRHESVEEYQHKLRARAGLLGSSAEERTHGTTGRSTTGPTTHAAARSTKRPLQGGSMRTGGCGQDRQGRAGTIGTHASPTRVTSPFPSVEDLNALAPSTCSSMHDVTQLAPSDDDTETRVFLGLVEAYPALEPSVVLQALRLCSGDPMKASDMMQRFDASPSWATAEVDSLAAALALAAAEDAEEREAAEAATHNARAMERHNALLTLVMLFPSAEVSAVEAVLTQKKGDFAAAYNVLLCAQEKMAQRVLWQSSTATLTPADQLRYEKLCGMFSSLHPDIVRSAFTAAEKDWSGTTAALNELTKELLSLEAVELPAGPVVWQPSTATITMATSGGGSSSSPTASPAPKTVRSRTAAARTTSPTAVSTEESGEAAYRAAQKEILSYGDWRQVREQAYLVNSQRISILGQASAAFHLNDGRMAKLLSREGHRLAIEYNHLNRLAMLALEHERLHSDATSTLDLHGFHTAEVHDVVMRRVALCQRKRIGRMRIVVGEGLHSKRGHGSLYTTLMDDLRTDGFLKNAVKVKSIKAGYVDVAIVLPSEDA